MGLISVIFSSEGAVADVMRGWVSPASTVIAVVIIGVLVRDDIDWYNNFFGVVCVLAGRAVWIDGFNYCGDEQSWESVVCVTAVVGD